MSQNRVAKWVEVNLGDATGEGSDTILRYALGGVDVLHNSNVFKADGNLLAIGNIETTLGFKKNGVSIRFNSTNLTNLAHFNAFKYRNRSLKVWIGTRSANGSIVSNSVKQIFSGQCDSHIANRKSITLKGKSQFARFEQTAGSRTSSEAQAYNIGRGAYDVSTTTADKGFDFASKDYGDITLGKVPARTVNHSQQVWNGRRGGWLGIGSKKYDTVTTSEYIPGRQGDALGDDGSDYTRPLIFGRASPIGNLIYAFNPTVSAVSSAYSALGNASVISGVTDATRYATLLFAVGEGELSDISVLFKGVSGSSTSDTVGMKDGDIKYLKFGDDSIAAIEVKTGKDNQTAISNLVNMSSDWTADHRCIGTALVMITMVASEGFASGFPDFTFNVGGKLYKTVTASNQLSAGTTAGNTNTNASIFALINEENGTTHTIPAGSSPVSASPSFAILDILMSKVYGLDISVDAIDLASFRTAFNNEQDTSNAQVGTYPTTCRGVLEGSRSYKQLIDSLLATAKANMTVIDGKITMIPNKYLGTDASTLNTVKIFDASNTINGIDNIDFSPSTQVYNHITITAPVTNVSGSDTFSLNIIDANALTEDNNQKSEKTLSLAMASVQLDSSSDATDNSKEVLEEIGRAQLRRSRLFVRGDMELDYWTNTTLKPGDVIGIDSKRYNLTGAGRILAKVTRLVFRDFGVMKVEWQQYSNLIWDVSQSDITSVTRGVYPTNAFNTPTDYQPVPKVDGDNLIVNAEGELLINQVYPSQIVSLTTTTINTDQSGADGTSNGDDGVSGSSFIQTYTGNVNIVSLDTSGGNGDGLTIGFGGDGGNAGFIDITSTHGDIDITSIVATGGFGGNASITGTGGDGGNGANIVLTALNGCIKGLGNITQGGGAGGNGTINGSAGSNGTTTSNQGSACAADTGANPNNATITIRINGSDKGAFTTNQSTDETIDLGTISGGGGGGISTYADLTAYSAGDLVNFGDSQWRAIASIPDTNTVDPVEGTGKWSEIVTDSQVVDDLNLTGSLLKVSINGTATGTGVTIPTKYTNLEAQAAVNLSTTSTTLSYKDSLGTSQTWTPIQQGDGEANVQADYTETDDSDDSYIKNKPELASQWTTELSRDALAISNTSTTLTYRGADDSIKTFTPIQQGTGEANVQANYTETDTSDDSYIRNKPELHNRFTEAEARQAVNLSDNGSTLTYRTLDGTTQTFTPVAPGAGEANVQSDWTELVTTEDSYIKNKPSVFANWDQTNPSMDDYISNKPTVAEVAVASRDALAISDNGSTLTYTDSSDVVQTFTPIQPGAGEANVQSDWTETVTTEDDYIKNRPTNFANWNQTDSSKENFIANKPTIPTKYTNSEARTALDVSHSGDTLMYKDSSGVTQTYQPVPPGTGEANVQVDWTETDTNDDSFIKNKPTIPTQYTAALSRDAIDIQHTGGTLTYIDKNDVSQAFTPALSSQSDWTVTDTLSASYVKNKPTTILGTQTTKLSGIETGAEVNIQSDWNVTNSSSDAFIKNKPTIGGGGGSASAAPVAFQTSVSAPSLTISFADSTADSSFAVLSGWDSGTLSSSDSAITALVFVNPPSGGAGAGTIAVDGTAYVAINTSSSDSLDIKIDEWVSLINGESDIPLTATKIDGTSLKLVRNDSSTFNANIFSAQPTLGFMTPDPTYVAGATLAVAGQVFTAGEIVRYSSDNWELLGDSSLTTTTATAFPSEGAVWSSVVTTSDLASGGAAATFQSSIVQGTAVTFVFNIPSGNSSISNILSGESLSTTTSGVTTLVFLIGSTNSVTISGTALLVNIGAGAGTMAETVALYVAAINGASNLSFTATSDGTVLKLSSSSVSLLSGTVGATNGFFISTSTFTSTEVVAGQVFAVGTVVQFNNEGYMYFGTSSLTTTTSSPLPSAGGDWDLISFSDSDARDALAISDSNGSLTYTDASDTVRTFTPNSADITLRVNGEDRGSFNTNQSSNETIDLGTAVREFKKGTKTGFEITFSANNTGSAFDDIALNFGINSNMPYTVQTGVSMSFVKGFNVGTGWQNTGDNRNFVCLPRSATVSDFTDDIVTAWNAGELTSQFNDVDAVRSDTNQYTAQLKVGDSNTVQFYKTADEDTTLPNLSDSGWSGCTIASATFPANNTLAGQVFILGSIVHFDDNAYMYFGASPLTTISSSPFPSAGGDWKQLT